MRTAATVLNIIQERGKRNLPVEDLYRQLYNPDLYLRAYAKLYPNKGALTPGSTSETVDAMTLTKIQQIIDDLRHERYRWTPVRRLSIPKKNKGKLRPLGLPSWSDKLLQEVIRQILEAYYDCQFSEHSHGFRPGRGCHTALSTIKHTWNGTRWFLEGDLKACYDRIAHAVLLSILAEKLHDKRFLRLIRHLLQAGYFEEWQYHQTLSGCPQGGVVSPILSNIYLDKLDAFVEQTLLPKYNRGETRSMNPQYRVLYKRMYRRRKAGNIKEAKALKKRLRQLPIGDPLDPAYRRLRYLRYADDTLFGFAGPKAEAEDIKRQVKEWKRQNWEQDPVWRSFF